MRVPLALLGATLAAACVVAPAAAAAPARIADFQTPDARLGEPGQFGRYVDVSRRRQDAVVSPQWQASSGRYGGDYDGFGLRRSPRAAPEKPAFILLSELPKLPAEKPAKRAPLAIGFASLGSASAGFLLVLAGLAGPLRRARRRMAVRLPDEVSEAAEVEEELAPITPWDPAEEPRNRPLMAVLTDL